MNKSEKSYNCPSCDRQLAVGNISYFFATCPDCKKWLSYDLRKKEIIDCFPAVKSEFGGTVEVKKVRKRKRMYYGWDKLKIEQMYSTQEEAREAEHSHYYTAKPCRNGHIAPRNVRGECNQCVLNAAKRNVEKKKRIAKEKKEGLA